ncbi:MAG: hypothetical protein NVS3B18_16010 [Candidatus Dormibacteria bacterium]
MLAGGAARRLPGKPLQPLHGSALISRPLAALRDVLEEVVVVAKEPLAGYRTLIEPRTPHHPACGILHALRCSGGRPVLVCAADMPLIDGGELNALLLARLPGCHAAVVPRAAGRLQPLCALYEPEAMGVLADFSLSMTEIVARLGALVLDRPAEPYLNINTPAELESLRRSYPKVNE